MCVEVSRVRIEEIVFLFLLKGAFGVAQQSEAR